MATNFGLAMTLGGNQMVHNDWRALFELYRFVQEAKEEDVRALIPRYLTGSKRTYVHLEKKSQQQARDGQGRR
jgi:predicted Zn-dependent peptidase